MNEVFLKGDAPGGYYVTIENADNPVVISKSKDPVEAYEAAIAKGYKEPSLLYVPENDSVFVFYAAH